MRRLVIAWPPVAAIAHAWTVADPVSRSRSLVTGRDYVSAAGRRRRIARLDVSALSGDRMGAGYMEALIRLLDGGTNLVRLTSPAINWHLDEPVGAALDRVSSSEVDWTLAGGDVDWTIGDQAVVWFEGTILTAEPVGTPAWPGVRVTGLEPGRLVARPGDIVQTFGGRGATAMVLRPAWSDASGTAVIALLSPVTAGRINLSARETAIFQPDEIPVGVQPVGDNWTYGWSFTEVFADEIGDYDEVDPWA